MIRTHGAQGWPSQPLLAFLAPSIATSRFTSSPPTSRFFSTSVQQWGRRDRNPNRGVSAIRRTGPRARQTLSVKKEDLPKPVLDPKRRTKIVGDNDHGLWQFLNPERRILALPDEDHAHGRAWTIEELEKKSWEDLHCLWWVCVKERNRLSTEQHERERLKAGYGEWESQERTKTIKQTQRAIKHVLTERWYAWEDARQEAMSDPSVNLAPEEGQRAYDPEIEHGMFDDGIDDEIDDDNEEAIPEHEVFDLPSEKLDKTSREAGEVASEHERRDMPHALVDRTPVSLTEAPQRDPATDMNAGVGFPVDVGSGARGEGVKQQNLGNTS